MIFDVVLRRSEMREENEDGRKISARLPFLSPESFQVKSKESECRNRLFSSFLAREEKIEGGEEGAVT